jgi:hypothetical protein
MLEIHIMMSLLIFCLTFLLMLRLTFLMDLTLVLVHERVASCLDTLVSTHVPIVVFVPCVGMVFPLRCLFST